VGNYKLGRLVITHKKKLDLFRSKIEASVQVQKLKNEISLAA
jgi:hypothetical protein